jgi:glycosyltransferase involved in cell wall biosynthesis
MRSALVTVGRPSDLSMITRGIEAPSALVLVDVPGGDADHGRLPPAVECRYSSRALPLTHSIGISPSYGALDERKSWSSVRAGLIAILRVSAIAGHSQPSGCPHGDQGRSRKLKEIDLPPVFSCRHIGLTMTGLIAHEWIESFGGAERVLAEMLKAFPDSDVVCLWNDTDQQWGKEQRNSWMASTPLRNHKALALPFMPHFWSNIDASGYDWVLSSSHAFAHHAARKSDTPRFAYVHTPARYLWAKENDPRGRGIAAAAGPALRAADRRAARSGARFAANSRFVQKRIERAWDAPARVIFPPIRVEHLLSVSRWAESLEGLDADAFERLPRDFVLGASRFVSYKRLDLVIRAAEDLDLPAVIAGSGPLLSELQHLAANARVPVLVIVNPSDSLLFALLQEARLFVFPPIEDFGIIPVEAMALGTPVVVNAVGGAQESVSALTGGTMFTSAHEIGSAAQIAMNGPKPDFAAAQRLFGVERFRRELTEWIMS